MFLELVKKLRDIDDSLSISLRLSDDNIYTISVDGMWEFGGLYSFSSPDIVECYNQVNYYISCLTDNDKFDKLVEKITTESLEV
jgi:hypothetical protein